MSLRSIILALVALSILAWAPPADADMRSDRRARAERKLSPVQERARNARAARLVMAQRKADRLAKCERRRTRRVVIVRPVPTRKP
ncbi:MAG: hypothetical protein V3S01_09580 [Dehalococcoidia bacterium]